MGGLLMDEMRALASSSIADLHNCIVSTYAAHPTSTLKEASLPEQQSDNFSPNRCFYFQEKWALVEPMCLLWEMAMQMRVHMSACVWELYKNANDCASYPPTLWQPPWHRDFFNVNYAAMLSAFFYNRFFISIFFFFDTNILVV